MTPTLDRTRIAQRIGRARGVKDKAHHATLARHRREGWTTPSENHVTQSIMTTVEMPMRTVPFGRLELFPGFRARKTDSKLKTIRVYGTSHIPMEGGR